MSSSSDEKMNLDSTAEPMEVNTFAVELRNASLSLNPAEAVCEQIIRSKCAESNTRGFHTCVIYWKTDLGHLNCTQECVQTIAIKLGLTVLKVTAIGMVVQWI